jgi:hypothetical protein
LTAETAMAPLGGHRLQPNAGQTGEDQSPGGFCSSIFMSLPTPFVFLML